jgi:hypothetical protein
MKDCIKSYVVGLAREVKENGSDELVAKVDKCVSLCEKGYITSYEAVKTLVKIAEESKEADAKREREGITYA